MDKALYWIWLTSKPAITPQKITSLLEYFGTAEEIYREETYANIPNIGSREIMALKNKGLSTANQIKNRIDEMGARIVTFEDEEYPDKLRNITPPPYILYVRGDITGLDEVLTIAVIGTRKEYTPYGKMVTSRFSSELARSGAVVVSGMAKGLDSVAAEGALRAGGRTIAVIGSGLDIIYPARNRDLAEEIVAHGAVITEYPPGSQALPEHFPARNRIIAGLSNGVLVTEAKERSGTNSTVRYAMEYGRDVFAVPGSIYEENYIGTHRYIQQGAKLTMNVNDILEEYPYAVRENPSAVNVRRTEPQEKVEVRNIIIPQEKAEDVSDLDKYKDLNDTDKRIVSLLMKKDMNIDELSREMEMNAGALNARLTLLEVKRLVKRLPGGEYRITT